MDNSEAQQKKKREYLILLLGLLVSHMADRLAYLAVNAASGTLDNFVGAANSLLAKSHTDAARMGRTLAGADQGVDLADIVAGYDATNEQMTYLMGFADDLANGRYIADDGTVNVAAITVRAGLYGLSLVGTANDAWLRTLDPETVVIWVLDPEERDHCPGCPAIAAENPWTAGTLPTVPGAGDTPCLGHCKCSLMTGDGREGFMGGTKHHG